VVRRCRPVGMGGMFHMRSNLNSQRNIMMMMVLFFFSTLLFGCDLSKGHITGLEARYRAQFNRLSPAGRTYHPDLLRKHAGHQPWKNREAKKPVAKGDRKGKHCGKFLVSGDLGSAILEVDDIMVNQGHLLDGPLRSALRLIRDGERSW